jgi:intracellular multiplication protein IcmL
MLKFPKVYFIQVLLYIFIAGFSLTACIQQPARSKNESNLAEAYMTPAQVLVWANEAVVSTYTTNFVNYPQTLQTASHYFTPAAWKAYYETLKNSGQLETIIKKKLVVSTVATSAPIILNEGVKEGKYTWTVQMPVLIKYQNAHTAKTEHRVVNLSIVRTPQYIGTRGLGIQSFSAQ